ncbi:MAG: RrF2 family transcriptional regulator [Anaerolineae bacterium]|jgi:Rrf2 family cysteine metabolism transcriptional repressor
MRLSAREQTGLRVMIALAQAYGEGPVPLRAVSEQQHLPLAYLEQVVGRLRRAGLLASVRGSHGGYYLTREPSQVLISQVIVALEGQLLTLDCLAHGPGACEYVGGCAARGVWLQVQESLERTLAHMTLADVLQTAGQDEENQ